MEPQIAGRWTVLARWSDRVDIRPWVEAVGGPDALGSQSWMSLRRLGAPGSLVAAWRQAVPADQAPWARIGDAWYPEALGDLPHPPPALWLRGDPGVLTGPAVAVVGSRACTPYGRRVARGVGRAIAEVGGVVVSGGARGIDTEAHKGAAEAGLTLMVLGAGLDVRTGPESRRVRDQVLETGGALVSELPPLDPPTRWTFPRRNRLIAALGMVTVVVEAGLRSGARITARLATELGRDVYAVPGPLDAPASAGCLQLLADGAHVVRDYGTVAGLIEAQTFSPERRLFALLDIPRSVEELATELDRPLPETLRRLALLEISGLVTRTPVGRYQRV